jgi:putative effector of murein hydrolase
MDKKKVREIATKGGKAAHAAGTAHKFTPDEARAAALKSVALKQAAMNLTNTEDADSKPGS